jgi:DNA-binding response OmpR family regulator
MVYNRRAAHIGQPCQNTAYLENQWVTDKNFNHRYDAQGGIGMPSSIYYIEDDADIAYGVQNYLQGKGLPVNTINSVAEAKNVLEKQQPSLVLIDWNLPDGDGDRLCQWLRDRWKELPVIFITVRGDAKDIVRGFRMGADDYIVKPFELEVLYSRICAILRRTGNIHANRLVCGPISIDRDKLQAFYEREEVNLSSMEYQLLLLLMENKNRTLTRQRLLELIWDANGNFVNDNTLTVTMKRLREKLHNPACIKTIRSFGYRMEDA